MNQEEAPNLRSALEWASTALTAALVEIASMPEGDERTRNLRYIATLLVGKPEELRAAAIRQCTDLERAEPIPDTHLEGAELEIVSRLTASDLEVIDRTLVAGSTSSWRKVPRVIGGAMVDLNSQLPGIPIGFYAQRVAALVQRGALLAQGNLEFIRLSEVRLPAVGVTTTLDDCCRKI